MRRARWISFFAITASACAAVVACSLQDGGVVDFSKDAEVGADATTDTSEPPFDSSLPNPDATITDSGATLCDLVSHDAAFFFCADFDDTAPTHGFTEFVTDGGTIAFAPSDASAPNLFSSTLVNPVNDNTKDALLRVPFDFSDAGDAGFSYVSISFDLRVDSLSLDAAATPTPAFVNTIVLLLEPKYALYAPIVSKLNQAPVMDFGAVDLNDGGVLLGVVGDGGVPIGAWNRVRIDLNIADGGAATLTPFINGVAASPPMPVSISPGAMSSDQFVLTIGMGAFGPVDAKLDFDNVIIRSDKF